MSFTPQIKQKNIQQSGIDLNNNDNDITQSQNDSEKQNIDSQNENLSNDSNKELTQEENDLALNLVQQLENEQFLKKDLMSVIPMIQNYFNFKNRNLREKKIILEQLFKHMGECQEVFVEMLLELLKRITNPNNLILIINEIIKQINSIKEIAKNDDLILMMIGIINQIPVIQQVTDVKVFLTNIDIIINQISVIDQIEEPKNILLLLNVVIIQISNLISNSKNEQEELNKALILLLTKLSYILPKTKKSDKWRKSEIQKKIHIIKQNVYVLITSNQSIERTILDSLSLSISNVLLFEYSLGIPLDLDFEYIFGQLQLCKSCWEPMAIPSSYIYLKIIKTLLDKEIPNQSSMLYDNQISEIIEIFNLYLDANQELSQISFDLGQDQKQKQREYFHSIQEMILNSIFDCITKFDKYYNNIQNFSMQMNNLILFLVNQNDKFTNNNSDENEEKNCFNKLFQIIYNCFNLVVEKYYDNLHLVIQKVFSLTVQHMKFERTFIHPLEFWKILAKKEREIEIKRSKHYTLGLINSSIVEEQIIPFTTLYYSDKNEADDPNDPNDKEIYYIAQDCLKSISKTEPEMMFNLLSKYFKDNCKDAKNCLTALVSYRCILSSKSEDICNEKIDSLTNGYKDVLVKYAKGTNVKLKCFAFHLIRKVLKKFPLIVINEQNNKFENLVFDWESPKVVTFQASPNLFNTTTVGCRLKISLFTSTISSNLNIPTEFAIVTKRSDSMILTCKFDSDSLFYDKKVGLIVKVEDDNRIKELVSIVLSNSDSDPLILNECYLIMSLILKHKTKSLSNLIMDNFDELYKFAYVSFKSDSVSHDAAIEYAVDLIKYVIEFIEEEKDKTDDIDDFDFQRLHKIENFDSKICELFDKFINPKIDSNNNSKIDYIYSDKPKLYYRLLPIVVKKLKSSKSYELNIDIIIENILKKLKTDGIINDDSQKEDDIESQNNDELEEDVNGQIEGEFGDDIMYQEIFEALIEIIPFISYKKYGQKLFDILIQYHKSNDCQTMRLTSDALSALFENNPKELPQNLDKINEIINDNLKSQELIQNSFPPVFSLISSIFKISNDLYENENEKFYHNELFMKQINELIKELSENIKNFTSSIKINVDIDDDFLDLCYMILDAYFALISVVENVEENDKILQKVEKQSLDFIRKIERIVLNNHDFVEISIKIVFVIICKLASESFADLSKPFIMNIIQKGAEFNENEKLQSASIKIRNILTNHC